MYVHTMPVKTNVYVRIAVRQNQTEGASSRTEAFIRVKVRPLQANTVENNVFLKFSAKARSRSTLETSHAPCSPVTTNAATSPALKLLGSSPSFTAAFKHSVTASRSSA